MGSPKRKAVSQPPIFRGHVSFRQGIPVSSIPLPNLPPKQMAVPWDMMKVSTKQSPYQPYQVHMNDLSEQLLTVWWFAFVYSLWFSFGHASFRKYVGPIFKMKPSKLIISIAQNLLFQWAPLLGSSPWFAGLRFSFLLNHPFLCQSGGSLHVFKTYRPISMGVAPCNWAPCISKCVLTKTLVICCTVWEPTTQLHCYSYASLFWVSHHKHIWISWLHGSCRSGFVAVGALMGRALSWLLHAFRMAPLQRRCPRIIYAPVLEPHAS